MRGPQQRWHEHRTWMVPKTHVVIIQRMRRSGVDRRQSLSAGNLSPRGKHPAHDAAWRLGPTGDKDAYAIDHPGSDRIRHLLPKRCIADTGGELAEVRGKAHVLTSPQRRSDRPYSVSVPLFNISTVKLAGNQPLRRPRKAARRQAGVRSAALKRAAQSPWSSAEPVRIVQGVDARYIVPGLSRGLALLQLFTKHKPRQTLQELAAGLELTRSAAYRLVYTLEKDGYIAREPGTRQYRTTSKVFTLGFEYLGSQRLTEVARPFLQILSAETRASSYLVLLDGPNAVYLARIAPRVNVVSNLQVGSEVPAYLTASGRILMAYQSGERLREILRASQNSAAHQRPPSLHAAVRQARQDRARGYVCHASLLDPGITSCASALLDYTGHAEAAITIVAPDHIFKQAGGESVVARLVVRSTQELSQQLGYRA